MKEHITPLQYSFSNQFTVIFCSYSLKTQKQSSVGLTTSLLIDSLSPFQVSYLHWWVSANEMLSHLPSFSLGGACWIGIIFIC